MLLLFVGKQVEYLFIGLWVLPLWFLGRSRSRCVHILDEGRRQEEAFFALALFVARDTRVRIPLGSL